jgi:hypothetical protein
VLQRGEEEGLPSSRKRPAVLLGDQLEDVPSGAGRDQGDQDWRTKAIAAAVAAAAAATGGLHDDLLEKVRMILARRSGAPGGVPQGGQRPVQEHPSVSGSPAAGGAGAGGSKRQRVVEEGSSPDFPPRQRLRQEEAGQAEQQGAGQDEGEAAAPGVHLVRVPAAPGDGSGGSGSGSATMVVVAGT